MDDSEQLRKGFDLLDDDHADGVVQVARGFVLLRAGRSRDAVKAFRRAVELQPEDSTRRLNLAAALLSAGELSGAKREAAQAIAIEPLLEDAYVLLAQLEPERGREWMAQYANLRRQQQPARKVRQ
jgi:Flp pilus assembly protein TadD